jgi:hypothetical protein
MEEHHIHTRIDIDSKEIGEASIDRKHKRITRTIKATATFNPSECTIEDIALSMIGTELTLPQDESTYVVDNAEAAEFTSLLLCVSRPMLIKAS